MMLTKLRTAALLACVLAVPMAGCSTIKTVKSAIAVATTASASQRDVATAVQAFDAVKVTATHYLLLPTCADGQSQASGCKKASVVPVLIKDVRAGTAARDSLWSDAKASPSGVGAKALYTAVIRATALINTDLEG